MGSDGRYTLTGALVYGDHREDCVDFPWAGGGSGIVWSLVFDVELWPHTLGQRKKLINLTMVTFSHYCIPNNCKIKFCSIFIVN